MTPRRVIAFSSCRRFKVVAYGIFPEDQREQIRRLLESVAEAMKPVGVQKLHAEYLDRRPGTCG